MTNYNLLLDTDSYKLSHFEGYPEGTEEMFSYLESRGGVYECTVFAGLQPILKRLEGQVVTAEKIAQARTFALLHGEPFNEDWELILKDYNGHLPIEIRAVKEGAIIPQKNALLTIKNTDKRFPWLTSYLETMLLRIWYPITVASRIYYMKKRMKPYFEATSDSENMDFALLDFASRGVTCYEASEIGGSAYLMHFLGSDNIPAVHYVNQNYNVQMSGFSVPATEHSIMCAYGAANEFASFERLLDKMGKENGILSVVSDTWDIYRATEYWGRLADKVKAKNMTLVVRPDSGEIDLVLPTILRSLEKSFGYTLNKKGFKVLNNVKVLWGDGIDEYSVVVPFQIAQKLGISADSIVTGSGGGLMQVGLNRDTNKFAIKGSNVVINGENIPIAKNPITDPGKQSKKGRLVLRKTWEQYETVQVEDENVLQNELEVVFRNGVILREQSWEHIRDLCKI